MNPITPVSKSTDLHTNQVKHKLNFPKLTRFFTTSTIALVLANSYSFRHSSLRLKATLITATACSFLIRLWLGQKYQNIQIPIEKKQQPVLTQVHQPQPESLESTALKLIEQKGILGVLKEHKELFEKDQIKPESVINEKTLKELLNQEIEKTETLTTLTREVPSIKLLFDKKFLTADTPTIRRVVLMHVQDFLDQPESIGAHQLISKYDLIPSYVKSLIDKVSTKALRIVEASNQLEAMISGKKQDGVDEKSVKKEPNSNVHTSTSTILKKGEKPNPIKEEESDYMTLDEAMKEIDKSFIVSIFSDKPHSNCLDYIENTPSCTANRLICKCLKIIRAHHAMDALYRQILIKGAAKIERFLPGRDLQEYLESSRDQEIAIQFINEPNSELKKLLIQNLPTRSCITLRGLMKTMPGVMSALGITYTTLKEIAAKRFLSTNIKLLCESYDFTCCLNVPGGFAPQELKAKALQDIAKDKILPLAGHEKTKFLFVSGIVEPYDKIGGKTVFEVLEEEIVVYKALEDFLKIPAILFEKGFLTLKNKHLYHLVMTFILQNLEGLINSDSKFSNVVGFLDKYNLWPKGVLECILQARTLNIQAKDLLKKDLESEQGILSNTHSQLKAKFDSQVQQIDSSAFKKELDAEQQKYSIAKSKKEQAQKTYEQSNESAEGFRRQVLCSKQTKEELEERERRLKEAVDLGKIADTIKAEFAPIEFTYKTKLSAYQQQIDAAKACYNMQLDTVNRIYLTNTAPFLSKYEQSFKSIVHSCRLAITHKLRDQPDI